MATRTTGSVDLQPPTRVHRTMAALFLTGGALLAAGGQTHPQGAGDTIDAHLLSMFSGPTWGLSHLLLLVGSSVCAVALGVAHRAQAFGGSVQRWLPAAVVAWSLGALETIPHLLAAGESDALTHHDATPVLDLHVLLQTVATPLVGFSTAMVAIAVARAAHTRTAWVLAVVGVVGGVVYGVAGPLVVATGNPAYTVLFPFLAGIALWFLGTGVRLLRR